MVVLFNTSIIYVSEKLGHLLIFSNALAVWILRKANIINKYKIFNNC